ncbi:prepilin-type N-terminal cleavage/methylation domain-containing protein [bacterium]|nr:prepilin-type N-terminal cleavage/methylation domain-containing protein [bacterium]
MVGGRRGALGFTLLELLITMAIIGLLASLVFPSYARSRSLSKLSSCKQNLRNIAAALEGYATDHGNYPDSLTKLTQGDRPYIKRLPSCKACGDISSYVEGYQHSEHPNVFTLTCKGSYHTDLDLLPDYPGYSPLHGGYDNPIQEGEERTGG